MDSTTDEVTLAETLPFERIWFQVAKAMSSHDLELEIPGSLELWVSK